MSLLCGDVSGCSYREAEDSKYKTSDLSGKTWRIMNSYFKNDFHKVSSTLVRYQINNPAMDAAVTVEWQNNMYENSFPFSNNIDFDLYLNLVNRKKMREQKLETLLDNINTLHKECKEEGYEVFSEKAENTAKDVLKRICHKFPDNEYFVYPTEMREIAIDCNPVDKRGVLILCDSHGGIACFVTIDGKNSRCRYDQYSDFSYDFLWRSFENIENTYHPDKIHSFSKIPTTHSLKYVLSNQYRPLGLSITAGIAV